MLPANDSQIQMISTSELQNLMSDVFTALDVAPNDVQIVVDALMDATLSGYDAHGVMRVPRYADELRKGLINACGEFKILKETASSAYVDAGQALGPVTATRAIDLACEKAAVTGIGCVSTKNSTDIARLASYLRQPAKRGFVTLLMVNDSGGLPSVAPFGGAARFFSTNPIAAGIPRGDEEPILLDLSTAVTSVGRLRVAAQRGNPVPDGWLIDQQGQSVVDPARFFAEPEDVFLLPLGGMLAGHKGFALQLLVDVLAGALGGAGVATGEDPGFEANAIFALAIDPEHFASRQTFTALVDQMVAGLKSAKTLPGVDTIHIPGEGAAQERHLRQTHGIPLTAIVRDQLAALLLELNLGDQYKAILQR